MPRLPVPTRSLSPAESAEGDQEESLGRLLTKTSASSVARLLPTTARTPRAIPAHRLTTATQKPNQSDSRAKPATKDPTDRPPKRTLVSYQAQSTPRANAPTAATQRRLRRGRTRTLGSRVRLR